MANSRNKTAFLARKRFERFLSRYATTSYLLTCTFQENIVEKREAERRLKPVRDWLSRNDFDWCGVWQRQKRGAWHVHLLISKRIDIVEFRQFIVARGWGVYVDVEKIQRASSSLSFVPGGEGQRSSDVVGYLTRYIVRDVVAAGFRERVVIGRMGNRVGTIRFSWAGGIARAYRAGRDYYSKVWQQDYNGRFSYHVVVALGLRRLGQAFPSWLGISPDALWLSGVPCDLWEPRL